MHISYICLVKKNIRNSKNKYTQLPKKLKLKGNTYITRVLEDFAPAGKGKIYATSCVY